MDGPLAVAAVSVAAAMAGAAAAGPLARLAARRAARQPVDVDIDAETYLIGEVASDRRLLARADLCLPADAFASAAHQRIWAALCDGTAAPSDPTLAAARSHTATRRPAGPADAAQRLRQAWEDRREFPGGRNLTVTEDPLAPQVRTVQDDSPSRQRRLAAVAAVGAAALPALAWSAWPGPSGPFLFALAALMMLAAACFVLALVDLDTLRADTATVMVGVGGGWLLAVAAAIVGGHIGRVVVAAAVTVAVVAYLEATTWLYRRLRGREGLGFGDTLVTVGTVGVPAALTGSPTVAFVALLGGLTAVAVGHVAAMLQGRASDVAAPAVPALASGWIVGWGGALPFL